VMPTAADRVVVVSQPTSSKAIRLDSVIPRLARIATLFALASLACAGCGDLFNLHPHGRDELAAVEARGRASFRVTFASVDEGRKVLMDRDEFVQTMSPFDRAVLLRTDRDVTEQEFLAFAGQNVTEWPEGDKAKVQGALQELEPRLAALGLPFPESVTMVHTTGREGGDAAYTRATAIILPPSELHRSARTVEGTVAHELFHVLSRANPDLRDKAYATIGFVKCNEVELPAELKSRTITNPDAPRRDHCIQLRVSSRPAWAVPLLVSKSPKYDTKLGGGLFDYLTFRWLLVERSDAGLFSLALKNGSPELVEMKDVSGFFEQVGDNTDYTIHPEEVLADNFRLLMMSGLPSPVLMAKVTTVLMSATPARPADGGADTGTAR
jgi:hypothetical protein